MEKTSHPLYYGGKLMPWAKAVVVKDCKGFIFLGGTEGRDPETGVVVKGAEAQARLCFEKIRSRLEELGSSLENIVKMTIYLAGEFPDGIAKSPTWTEVRKAEQKFFKEHCPSLCADNSPPPLDLVGVTALAMKEMLVEISIIAALPDD